MERSRWYLNWLRRQWTGPQPASGALGMYNWRGQARIAGLVPRGGGGYDKQTLQWACADNGVKWRVSWTKQRLWQALLTLLKAAPVAQPRIRALR